MPHLKHLLALCAAILLAACGSSLPAQNLTPSLNASFSGSLNVVAGTTAQLPLTVETKDVNGTAQLSFQGAPSGVTFTPGSVVLSGGEQLVTLTCTVAESVTPGTYPVQATVSFHDAQATAALSLVISGTSGALQVAVSAPAGVTPSVEVRNAAGTTVQTISATGSTTLTGLAPGDYTVVAQNASAGGYTFVGSVTGSPATVQAGQTAQASVSYGATTGALALSVSAPEGVPTAIAVLDQNGTTVSTGTSSLTELAPGTYTVIAQDTSANGYTYAASVTGSPATVVAGQTAQVGVSYAANTGSLTVSVSAPAGVTPSVEVHNAAGDTVQTISATGSTTLTALAPGDYTVVAQSASAGSYTYAGSVTGSPATVVAGQTAQSTVSYGATTGALTLSVSAPEGVPTSIAVRDQNGTTVSTGSSSLTHLAPGTYTVIAQDTSANGYTYTATVTGSPATVVAGQTAEVAISYAASTGSLTVSVSAPTGVTPSVEVHNAAGDTVQTISATGSTTLTDLAPGNYTVVAQDASADGYTYAGTVTGSPATVTAGQTATSSVSYAATTGSLSVSVSAPDGLSVSVAVKDAGGTTVQTLTATGTTTLTGLAPGDYTVVAQDASADGYTYAGTVTGSPATVAAGQTATSSVSFAATTGSLTVTVNAPSGVTPSVDVVNAGGSTVQTISTTGDTTLTGLAPGDYTVVAQNASADGFTYAATVTGSPATVQGGQTATSSVSYAATTGSLTVTLASPPGVTPSVDVLNAAGGTVQTLSTTGDTTLTDLAPGDYTLVAHDVAADGYTYAGTVTGSPATVTAGQTATGAVSYAATTGSFTVTVTSDDATDLPAAVSVTNAQGDAVATISTVGATTLTGLPPGDYTVTAQTVSYGGSTYRAGVTGSPATVQAGQTAAATVSYLSKTGSLEVTVSAPADLTLAIEIRNSSNTLVGTVTAAGTTTLDGLAPDTYSVIAPDASGAGHTFTANVTGSPATVVIAQSTQVAVGYCPSLAIGEVLETSATDIPTLCLAGGAEYTVIPLNLSTSATYAVTLTPTNTATTTGAPTPIRAPSGDAPSLTGSLGPDASLGVDDLTFVSPAPAKDLPPLEEARRTLGATRPSVSPTLIPVGSVPVVGDSWTLNRPTDEACAGTVTPVTATVQYVGAQVILVTDDQNPAGGFASTDYQTLGTTLDTLVLPRISSRFGAPTDLDTNGRLVVFITRGLNEQSPPASSSVIMSEFLRRDLYSSASCSPSNEGEILYLLAPDPTGAVNSNVRTVSFVLSNAPASLTFELEHLINASRRLYVTNADTYEDAWLDNALASMAVEQVYFAASFDKPALENQNLVVTNITTGTNASKNVAAFNAYVNRNYGYWRPWLQNPGATGMVVSDANAGSNAAGEGWSFLRYAKDRLVGANQGTASDTFLYDLVNADLTGLANVENALGGADPKAWMEDYFAAVYTDDAISGVAPEYTFTSWNFRSLYTALNGSYILQVQPLTVPTSASLVPGGSAKYFKFAVPAGVVGSVAFSSDANFDGTTMRYVVVRRN